MLDEENKKNPFTVPENYFQNFNADIINKIKETKVAKKKTISLWQTVGKWISVAAIISGVAFVGLHYLENKTENVIQNNLFTKTQENTEDITNLQNDYHQFVENEATRIVYSDLFYDDDL